MEVRLPVLAFSLSVSGLVAVAGFLERPTCPAGRGRPFVGFGIARVPSISRS